LANTVARPDSSAVETFVETGRLRKYVEELSAASVVMLGVAKGASVEGGGGTLAIWNVKSSSSS